MIISASRRTDIPAFYAPWLERRLKEGFVLVRNPRNPAQVRYVSLAVRDVDCFVFWTKDARPMFGLLDTLDRAGYPYYFQWTVTPYGPSIEPGLAQKEDILAAFRTLGGRLGSHRTIWRYDPVLISKEYPAKRHLEDFDRMSAFLEDSTERCVLSFVDIYGKLRGKGLSETSPGTMRTLAREFSAIAEKRGIDLLTCCEEGDFENVGVRHGACIDKELVERLAGRSLKIGKDRNQRPLCECAESADIGVYDTCPAGCVYCYANRSKKMVDANRRRHTPESSLLIGEPSPEELDSALLRRS